MAEAVEPGEPKSAGAAAIIGSPRAESLHKRVGNDPHAPIRMKVWGTVGSGKTSLLRCLVSTYIRSGRPVITNMRGYANNATLISQETQPVGKETVIVVDDVHLVTPTELKTIGQLLSFGASTVIAGNSWPNSDMSYKIQKTLYADGELLVLFNLNLDDMSQRARVRVGRGLNDDFCQALVTATGGLPRLIDGVLALDQPDDPVDQLNAAEVRSEVAKQVEIELKTASESLRLVLSALAIGCVAEPSALSQLLDLSPSQCEQALTDAYAVGFLQVSTEPPWGWLLPVVEQQIITRMGRSQLYAMQRMLVTHEIKNGHFHQHTANRMIELEFAGRDVIERLQYGQFKSTSGGSEGPTLQALSIPPATNPGQQQRQYSPGSSSDSLAAAAAALQDGKPYIALHETDTILSDEDAPEALQAAKLAAVAYAQADQLHRSHKLHQFITPGHIGSAAADAVAAAIGIGNLPTAHIMVNTEALNVPTSTAGGLKLLADGLLDSAAGADVASVETLIQAASSLMHASGHLTLIDSPAVIAALAALNCGQFNAARSVLLKAQATPDGGIAFNIRHEILLAWTAMLSGDVFAAESHAHVVANSDQLFGRNVLLMHGLCAGVNRRKSDFSQLGKTGMPRPATSTYTASTCLICWLLENSPSPRQ